MSLIATDAAARQPLLQPAIGYWPWSPTLLSATVFVAGPAESQGRVLV
jgi:hypothetical protein